jgi:hypothetical protein
MLFTFTRFFPFFVGRSAHSAPFITAELAETAIRTGMFFLFFPFHEQLTVFLYYIQDYPGTGIVKIWTTLRDLFNNPFLHQSEGEGCEQCGSNEHPEEIHPDRLEHA